MTEYTRDFGQADEYQLELNTEDGVLVIHGPGDKYFRFEPGEAFIILSFLSLHEIDLIQIIGRNVKMPEPYPEIGE